MARVRRRQELIYTAHAGPALLINLNSAPYKPLVCSANEDSVKPFRQGGTRNFYIAAGLVIIAAELVSQDRAAAFAGEKASAIGGSALRFQGAVFHYA